MHVLHDPADARACSAAARSRRSSPRRRRLEAQGVSRARPDLAGHDALRRGPRRWARRASRASSRRCSPGRRFPWIRFLYAYPKTLDDSVLELMAREPRFVPYVDIPLQHVSRPILSAMRRGGDAASYLRDDRAHARARARHRDPDDVHRRLSRARARRSSGSSASSSATAEFDNLGAFTYSPEPGSGSEPLGDPVPAEEKERRKDFLLSLQQPIARGEARARCAAATVEAIVEGPSRGDRVPARGPPALAGARDRRPPPDQRHGRPGRRRRARSCRVEIDRRRYDYDLVGRIVDATVGVERRVAYARHPRSRSAPTDLPRGGVGTIGNFDGVHLGHRKILETVVARARETGRPVLRHHLRAAPAGGAAARTTRRARIQTLRQKEEAIEAIGIDALLVIPFTRDFSLTEPEEFVRGFLRERLGASELYLGRALRLRAGQARRPRAPAAARGRVRLRRRRRSRRSSPRASRSPRRGSARRSSAGDVARGERDARPRVRARRHRLARRPGRPQDRRTRRSTSSPRTSSSRPTAST